VQQSRPASNPTFPAPMRCNMSRFFALAGAWVFFSLALFSVVAARQQPSAPPPRPADDIAESQRLSDTIAGLKRTEKAMYLYERIEREESWKQPDTSQPDHITVSRVFPAGTGIAHIVLSQDGRRTDDAAYHKDLEKLSSSLEWAATSGHDQDKAFAKVDKKLKERYDIIDATRNAFLYTFSGREIREGRPLLKYRIDPNPAFKPQNRNAGFLTKVKGYIWIDEATSQLARVQGQIIDDISFGIFLGKIYKGSRFSQERYPDASGVWLPSFSQYDFDGRKLFSSISIHQKTYYSGYRRVGPPKEALPLLRAELQKMRHEPSASSETGP